MKIKTCKSDILTSHYTVEAARQIKETTTNRQPAFDVDELEALMPGYQMWDNWAVRLENGNLAKLFGHKVLIALVRPRDADFSQGERIAYFYSKDGIHYHVGGLLFDGSALYEGIREWSGSTILREDGKLQTFYTVSYGAEVDGVWQTVQRFATAIQTPSLDENGVLRVSTPIHHKLLGGACEPDGQLYETPAQASVREKALPTAHSRAAGSDQTENNCFRDPFFYKHPKTGIAYIIFEGNTGEAFNPAGVVADAYVGQRNIGRKGFAPTADMLKANGCIGVIELTNEDYTYGVFRKPLVTSNLVTDEIERINAFHKDGKFYLFCCGHGNKNALNKENPDLVNRDYMLGFVAKDFGEKMVPLNGSGVVVQQKSGGEAYGGQAQNQQYCYSWIIVPDDEAYLTGRFKCLAYANYSKLENGTIAPVMGIAPTLEIELKGSKTRIVGMKYDIKPVK